MATLPITIAGGTPNFTLTIREENEISGNRYGGGLLTGSSTVNFSAIPDGLGHVYKVIVADAAGCVDEKLSTLLACPCLPINLTTTPSCTGEQEKLDIVWNNSGGQSVRIQINGDINVDLTGQASSGSQSFNATAGSTYTVTVTNETYLSCSVTGIQTVGSCAPTCTLSITLGTPSC